MGSIRIGTAGSPNTGIKPKEMQEQVIILGHKALGCAPEEYIFPDIYCFVIASLVYFFIGYQLFMASFRYTTITMAVSQPGQAQNDKTHRHGYRG